MNYYGKKSLTSMLKIILNILLIIGIGLFIYLSINLLSKQENYTLSKYIVFSLFTIGSISLMFIILNLRKILDSLIYENPFIIDNVKRLKKIAIECFIITFCYIINFIINLNYKNFDFVSIDAKGIHTDMEFLIFLFSGCFILVLSNIFEHAVKVKEENDLTI